MLIETLVHWFACLTQFLLVLDKRIISLFEPCRQIGDLSEINFNIFSIWRHMVPKLMNDDPRGYLINIHSDLSKVWHFGYWRPTCYCLPCRAYRLRSTVHVLDILIILYLTKNYRSVLNHDTRPAAMDESHLCCLISSLRLCTRKPSLKLWGNKVAQMGPPLLPRLRAEYHG